MSGNLETTKLTKKEKSWMFYDWANSAFTLIIMTAVMPIFFKGIASGAGMSDANSTAIWGYATSFGTLILAISAPVLGSLAAYKGMKKKLFSIFVYAGVFFTIALAFVPTDNWQLLLAVYMVSFLAYQGSIVIYDSFLTDVTSNARMDKVSSYGYAMGYFGSLIPFALSIFLMVVNYEDILLMTRLSFVITGIWWGIFSIPLLKNVNQEYGVEREEKIISKSFGRVIATIKDLKQYKNLARFLVAYFFYIDGVNTVIAMATAYAIDLGVSAISLLILLVLLQVVAVPFSIFYQLVAKKIGAKPMLLFGIATYIVICISGFFVHTEAGVLFVTLLIGSAQGGVQALSRSMFGRMVPKEKASEYFGFYSIFSKFAAIMGPILVATVTLYTQNSSAGVLSLAIMFIIGGGILLFVKEENVELSVPYS